jgi:dolichol-phosphate mannosyltransferase
VYGCKDCLRALHGRLTEVLSSQPGGYELIFVDDRSPDGAWELLEELSRADRRVRALRLSRNFGQHAAITAGLAATRGRWTVVMDCDLQDPPEEIPRMLAKAAEGYDVVLCTRQERVQSLTRRLAASAYFRAHNMLAKGDLHTNYTNLSLLSRKVVDAFLTLNDRDRQYLLIVHWLGYNRTSIQIRQADRHAGRSSYASRQLMKVALDGLFFQTTVLLRWIVYVGFLLAAAGAALAGYALLAAIEGRDLPQWLGLPMLGLFLAAFIIISTGVTGLYVGKIFEQVKGRPLYVVDEVASSEDAEEMPRARPPAADLRAEPRA